VASVLTPTFEIFVQLATSSDLSIIQTTHRHTTVIDRLNQVNAVSWVYVDC